MRRKRAFAVIDARVVGDHARSIPEARSRLTHV
jgi:hypothetical protein